MQRVLAVALPFLLLLPAAAQDPWSPSNAYDPSVPTPESVLGYRVGERFTHYDDLVRYYERLASVSDRLRMQPYGRSVEGRTLYLVTVSAPENLARLEEIRAANARLSDPRRTSAEEAQRIASTMPATVWLSYNVHGNESVSSEAALQVAYELTASQDARVLDWLKNTVIILDPIVNPDGRERYVHFYNSTAGVFPRPDRFAAEHQERWPGGRFNHYLFDLNRDWAWQSQPESRARVAAYRAWNPQVHVDYHEMGAGNTYYFAPPAKPIHPTLTPALDQWFEIYGRGNAAAFDRYGFRYFTRENYDLFYPAFGDSWPSLNGAVGMTYEQAGGGFAGLAVELAEGQRLLTLRDRAVRHFVSSLATIDTSVKNRESRLRDFYEFRQSALRAGSAGPVRQYFLLRGGDPGRVAELVESLLRQGIEVQQTTAAFEAEGLAGYLDPKPTRRRIPEGSYVVDLAQPAGFLAQALLEREAKLNAMFFYDVTAWTLPLAAGVEAYASRTTAPVALQPVTARPAVAGGVEGEAAATAYVFSWEQSGAMRLLSDLLEEDLKAYVALKPFKVAGQEFAAGSIIVPVETNPADLRQRLARLTEGAAVRVFAVATQMSESGVDLGSNRVRFVRKPRVAILMDAPVSPTEYGALWHLFEQKLDVPFTPLRTESLGNVDLSRYNVLILPGDSGDGRAYPRYLDKGVVAKLSEWVRGGGVLIGMRGGAVFASKNKSGLTSVGYRYIRPRDEQQRIQEEKEKKPEGKPEERPGQEEGGGDDSELQRKLMTWEQREEERFRQEIPGAILRVAVDTSHPLGYGYGRELAVLNRTAPILEPSGRGDNPLYFPAGELKLSGFISEENQKKLAQTAYAVRESQGRGHIILFADSPVFRGFWDSTARLLMNAVFFGNVSSPYVD